MSQITIRNLNFGFRGPSLFEEINCEIEAGQRIGLLGRNGTGKTTLLKMLAGELAPDHGEIVLASGTRLARLVQDVPEAQNVSVLDMVQGGFPGHADTAVVKETAPEELSAWEVEQRSLQMISRMQLPAEAVFGSLSSGMKRRVLLARALAQQPDVLLLDEPTNHLDVESIAWLEGFLSRWSGTLIFVTHDRTFLQNLATRILELDRGRLFDWQCDYATFLERKEAALEAEEKQNALFDKRLAEEEAWIRQGIKARRTRNMGRVRALVEMRRERQERRNRVGKVDLQIDSGLRSGQLVVSLKNVSFEYAGSKIFENFSTMISRGEKIGIIGPNGAGKSTLLKVILGKLQPSSGNVRLGTNLQIAYFDQLREHLDPEQTVQENVGEGYENIMIGGRSRHIIGYLADFLFSADRSRTQIKYLSGGERNRVLLAKLFAKPANVIVLDEPTNDLDLETLEILEARLVEYPGTVLMVSHDRTFLDHVVTGTIVFEPEGVFEYDGGYEDWQRQKANQTISKARDVKGHKTKVEATAREKVQSPDRATPANGEDVQASLSPKESNSGRKLKYAERLELEKIPQQIQELESAIKERHRQMELPDFFQKPHAEVAKLTNELAQLQAQVDAKYLRWEELEQLSQS
ncbi:MAG: ATP-binding cassette domain-containing protein [Planctomycetaceae bacterium]|nr:ATP-binding cassette domain-containing protein [Planctomycetaceae bacterium]